MLHSFEEIQGNYMFSTWPVSPYKDPEASGVAVRLSFLDGFVLSGPISVCDAECLANDAEESRQRISTTVFCMNIGKEICIFTQDSEDIPIDRRVFKAPPTCHSFKPGCKDGSLLIGLGSGEIQLICPLRKDCCKVYNEDKTIEKTGVTCVLWVPNSPHQFLVSHSSGCLYLYDEKLLPVASPPSYDLFKEGVGFSGYMRSYFAGLLCVDWSSDGRFVVVGGQDDLVTVWSMAERAVICRGQGHRSWVSTVRFDPYLTPIFTNSPPECCQSISSSRSHTKSAMNMNDNCAIKAAITMDSNGHENSFISRTYRIGSVGQDTMFCLWDLTEDVIRQGVLFIRESALSLALESHSNSCKTESSNAAAAFSNDATGLIGSSNTGRSSLRLTLSNKHNCRLATGQNAVSSVRSRNVSTLLGFLTFGKRRSTTHSSHTAVGSLRRQFGPPLSPEQQRVTGYASNSSGGDSPAQDRWNTSNGVSSNSSSLCRPTDPSCMFDMNDLSVFGSPMCPRFGDVPILEPLVCRTMHQHRLTDLVFRRNTVHVVCQQGLIRSWSRPSPSKEGDYLDEPLIDDLGVPCAIGLSDTGSFYSSSDPHSKRMDVSQSNLTSLT
ncbi:unnamed protein product [Dicrocoelium dendriticum]|nr:unnamed protein product [Dicrocoelium dendriticum]